MRDRISLVDEKIYLFEFWLVLDGAASLENLIDAAMSIFFQFLLVSVLISQDSVVFYWGHFYYLHVSTAREVIFHLSFS